MNIELVSALLMNGGREAILEVEMSEGERVDRRSFTIPSKVFSRMELEVGAIGKDDLLDIIYAERQYQAIKKSFDILAYGRNSAKTLVLKLRNRGFEQEFAEGAAKYMCEHGYIKEEDDALREAECAVGKLLGAKRVLMCVHEKGYDGASMEAVKEYLRTVDFVDNCVKLIRSRYKILPKDNAERQKVIAALVRYGYSTAEIREAAKIVDYYRLP